MHHQIRFESRTLTEHPCLYRPTTKAHTLTSATNDKSNFCLLIKLTAISFAPSAHLDQIINYFASSFCKIPVSPTWRLDSPPVPSKSPFNCLGETFPSHFHLAGNARCTCTYLKQQKQYKHQEGFNVF
jgi:hypothetical protein